MTVAAVVLNQDCRTLDPAALGARSTQTDPPYSAHVHNAMTSCAQDGDRKGVRHRDAGFAHLSMSLADYLRSAATAMPGWSVVYTDLETIGDWCAALRRRKPKETVDGGPDGRYVRAVIVDGYDGGVLTSDSADDGVHGVLPWIRWSSPQQSGDRPPQGAEALVLAHGPGKMTWRGPGNLTHLNHKALRGDDKHPTEKPLDQALDLISWFTDPGDLVYDPTCGSGTFGVACVLLGRHYVGCNWGGDDDAAAAKHWAEFAAKRIDAAQRGTLSPRDAERLRRWLSSVLERTGFDPSNDSLIGRVSELIEVGCVPEEFKALTKGQAKGLLQ